MPVILLIGEDPFLLETRAAVLRSAGADIFCSDVSSAVSVLEKQSVDLMVLCHSIPAHLCQTLAEIVQHNWPATRILQISAVREWEDFEAPVGVYRCSADPSRLIASTIELLARRKPPASVRASLPVRLRPTG